MKFERDLYGFVEDFGFSPLPGTRESSASVRLNMNYLSGDSDSADEFSTTSLAETEEGRLSRSLQTWMPEHIWSPVEPREKPPLEPVFSGRLGKEIVFPKLKYKSKKKKVKRKVKENTETRCHTAPVRRTRSNDSLETSLSLLSCSSREEAVDQINIKDRRRRRRKVVLSRASTTSSTEQEKPESKWVKFATKSKDIFNRMMRTKAVMMTEYGGYSVPHDNESEAFKHLDKDEQKSLYKAGFSTGLRYVNRANLLRSSSLNNVADKCRDRTPRKTTLKRVMSSNCKHPWGKPLDIAQIKRERMNKLLAIEQAKQQEKEKSKRLRRQRSRSITNNSQVASSVSAQSQSAVSGSAQSVSSDTRPDSPFGRPSTAGTKAAENVTVWKNDREILEIDLKRELTVRVQKRIDSTRNALKRCTGVGDNNDRRVLVGKHDEFPRHIENDYSYKPRIIQKMRISPHLSGVIHNDIQVRMGRPRYHEIRVDDLVQWNKGQTLGRAHRNLKVFNWLHSLSETDFIKNVIPEILDEPPSDDVKHSLEMLHVESADEPDVKPLFKQYEVRIL